VASVRGDRSALALAAFLAVAGTLHFVTPAMYDDIVPGWLPFSARFWTIASGVAEVAVAVIVAVPSTRAAGGLLAVALFVVVFPANVKMAIDWADRPTGEFLVALARLPLQIPLVWWGYRVYRRGARDAVMPDERVAGQRG
jgi:uncharacterized membrane protein